MGKKALKAEVKKLKAEIGRMRKVADFSLKSIEEKNHKIAQLSSVVSDKMFKPPKESKKSARYDKPHLLGAQHE